MSSEPISADSPRSGADHRLAQAWPVDLERAGRVEERVRLVRGSAGAIGSSAETGTGTIAVAGAPSTLTSSGGRPRRRGSRVEEDLGPLGPEHLAGVVEQGDDRRVELRRVLEDPAGLVEELEPLVLLALREVGPVGEEDGHERDEQEPQEARVEPEDRHGEQRQARVGDRHQAAELDHLGQLLELRRAARQRDRGRDRQRREDRRRQGRRERRQPVGGVGRPAEARHQVEDDERRRRPEPKFARLNANFSGGWRNHASATADPTSNGEDVVVRREQEEPDDRRELAQREASGPRAGNGRR